MIKQHLKGKYVKVYEDLKKIADGDVEDEDRDSDEDEDEDRDYDDGDEGEVDGAIVTTNLIYFFYCYYKFLDDFYMSIYGHVYIM